MATITSRSNAERNDGSTAEFVESVPLTENWTEVNGMRVHYVSGGAGHPVVFFPGWPRSWREFAEVLPLVARCFRVIAVDPPGAHRSRVPRAGADRVSPAGDMTQLLECLGVARVHAVGASLGSAAALALARHCPERVGRAVLLDVNHGTQPAAAQDEPPPLRSTIYRRSALLPAPGALGDHKVTKPVLALAGRECMPRVRRALEGVAENMTFRTVNATGHYLAEEVPRVVANEIVRFLCR